jgi:hypothetical protein
MADVPVYGATDERRRLDRVRHLHDLVGPAAGRLCRRDVVGVASPEGGAMSCEWFIRPDPAECPACERPFERVKIGTSAIGWAFSFADRPDLGLTDKASWLAHLDGKVIEDEYGKVHTAAEFAAFVERKEGLKRA